MTGSVCYVLPSLYPSGGNKMCVEHVKRLAKRGHFAVISVVSKHKEDNAKWLEVEGVKIIPFTREELNKYENVVATYWETYYHIKNLKLSGPKFKYFVQSKEEEFETDLYRKLKVIQSLMDPEFEIFTEAKWLQQYVSEIAHKPSILVPNCVELPKDFVPDIWKGNKPFVLVEGEATTKWKNITFAARVANLLRPDFHVCLLTSTSYSKIAPFIWQQFDEISSGLSWTEALKLIGKADVLYRPSLLEGFNGAMSEAMLLGTPFVGNKIPGNYEVCVDGWNSLLVNDSKDLFEAASKIKQIVLDKTLADRLKMNGRLTAGKFSDWNKSIDVLEDTVFCLE